MKFKLVAHTPVGKFVSVVSKEASIEDANQILDILKEDVTYFKIETENGIILLKNEVLNNTIFEIIRV